MNTQAMSVKEVVLLCKQKLLQEKSSLLNRMLDIKSQFKQREFKGDEADQSFDVLLEHQLLANQEHLLLKLREIELALVRIQDGTYGICEVTEEPIELQRLLSLPWTRLSIEGAEFRENLRKRFTPEF